MSKSRHTEAQMIGPLKQKCDEDEFAALKTGKPHDEKEAEGYDITAPLHDASGKLVGTIGIDFKLQSGLTHRPSADRGRN